MQQIDPRDRWEYLRIRLSAFGSQSEMSPPARQCGRSGNNVIPMRAVPGFHSLREILERTGKLPQDRAVWIALGICTELSRLHRNGVVHGHLSPEKVLLGLDDQVQLIVPESGAAGTGRKRLDTPEAFAYISPEQAVGRCADAPRRRHGSATEMALDLANPGTVITEDRPALREWRKRQSPWAPVVVSIVRSLMAAALLLGLLYWISGRA